MSAARGHASHFLSAVACLVLAPPLRAFVPQDAAAAPDDLAAATRRMAARLADLYSHRDPRKDPFLTADSVAVFREKLEHGGLSLEDRIQTEVQLANALMTSGEPRQATEKLGRVIEELENADRTR